MNHLTDVYNEWQNNPEFREAFKKNPKEALENWGYHLNTDDLEKMLKFKKDNDGLDERINK